MFNQQTRFVYYLPVSSPNKHVGLCEMLRVNGNIYQNIMLYSKQVNY